MKSQMVIRVPNDLFEYFQRKAREDRRKLSDYIRLRLEDVREAELNRRNFAVIENTQSEIGKFASPTQ